MHSPWTSDCKTQNGRYIGAYKLYTCLSFVLSFFLNNCDGGKPFKVYSRKKGKT